MSSKILILSVFLAILVNLPGSTSNKSPPGYVGCFKDAWKRVMPTRLGTFATRQMCIDGCKKRKLPYAGIQAGGICFCGNQYNKHGKANNCNQKCKKDTNCGGYLANAVYVIPAKTPPGYVGCFKDAWKRVMPTRLGTFDNRQMCIDGCKKRKLPYAGIQAAGICFCGTQYNKHGKANNCNTNCKRDIGCGGYLANSVYIVPPKTPQGYVGCFKDAWKRVMSVRIGTFDNRQMCIDGCKKRKLPYAGIQAAGICFCGTQYNKHGKANNCNTNCKRDIGCGGYLANSVFIVPPKTPLGYVGCFKDAWKRVMPTRLGTFDNRQMCIDGCKKRKLPYAGIQAAGICYCGNQYNKHGKANNCDMNCKRDIGCGGYLANSVYKVPVVPDKHVQPKGYLGCYKDNKSRVMPNYQGHVLNPSQCIDLCRKKEEPYAGLQNYRDCWCGKEYNKEGKGDGCNLPCKAGGICGGFLRNSVYKISAAPEKYIQPKGYLGCYKDNKIRVMPNYQGHVLNPSQCIDLCRKKEEPYAGLQNYRDCWCGKEYNKEGKGDGCNLPCKAGGICGGFLRNSVYKIFGNCRLHCGFF